MAEELPGSNPQHAKGDEAAEEDMEVETSPVQDQPDGAENAAVNGGGGSKRGRQKEAAAEGLEEGAVSKKPKVFKKRSFEEERMEKVEGKGEGGADMEEGGGEDEEFEGDKARSFDEERMEKLDGKGERGEDSEGGDGDDKEAFVGDKARSVEEERMEKVEGKGEGAEDLEGGGDDEKEFKGEEEEGGGDLEEGRGDVEKETSGVSVGPKVFTSSVEMFEYFFKLLHSWSPNLDLNKYEHMVLHDLLNKGHPEPTKKIGVGIQAFQVRYHPAWKSRCFFVVRVDETIDDFSFRKCVDNILPLPDNMKARLSSGGNKVMDHKKAWSNQKGGRGSRGRGGRGGGGHGRGRGGKMGGGFRK